MTGIVIPSICEESFLGYFRFLHAIISGESFPSEVQVCTTSTELPKFLPIDYRSNHVEIFTQLLRLDFFSRLANRSCRYGRYPGTEESPVRLSFPWISSGSHLGGKG